MYFHYLVCNNACTDRSTLSQTHLAASAWWGRNLGLTTHPNTAPTLAHANLPPFLGETDEWEEEDGCRIRYAAAQTRCMLHAAVAGPLREVMRVVYYVVFIVT